MRPAFSRRTKWNLEPNRIAAAVDVARRDGRALVDLTESNPTRCDFPSTESLVRELGDARGTIYEPHPLGHIEARNAIAAHHRARGASIDPSRIALSASTSEAYGWLFKLLCDRDDAVLVPTPSYPLFDWLATMEDVRLVPYPLVREESWRIDLDSLQREITEKTRVILIVHPNNPTGSFTRRDDAEALEKIAERHGLALVVDEVFADYALGDLPRDRLPTFAGRSNALTFVMSGLSKVAALPQLKLGWTLVQGPDAIANDALARLEMIADTYLSVATPVQRALPNILASIAPIQDAIRARVGTNLRALDDAIGRKNGPIRRLPIDGGWYAILEVPRTKDEDEWVESLVREDGVIVHPGYFFDLDRDGYLVVSLILPSETFRVAIDRLVARVGE
jgi:aspartate/methionine/tyrosine aminotransferase